MATVKKSNKKKIIVPICIVLVIAIIAASVVVVKAKTSGEQVSLSTISTDNIVESVNATGDVTSGASREYKAATVATCKEVFVKVGDKVKKGDKLATFDTEALQDQIASLQATYNDAKSSYNKALAAQKEAKANLNAVEKQIAPLEKKLASLQRSSVVSTTKKKKRITTTKSPAKKQPAAKQSETSLKESNSDESSTSTTKREIPTYPSTIAGAVEALNDLVETITSLSDDIKQTNEITRLVMTTIAEELASGNYSPDAIADSVGKAVADAIKEGIIDETKLIVESGVAVDMIEAAVKGIDWAALGSSIVQSNDVQLSTTQLQLAALYAQKEIYSLSSDLSTVDAQKKVMNTSKSALDTLKESQNELASGWVASLDGVVTENSLEPGAQTSALTTGIKIENTETLVATISLGEYDIHKVKVGMEATVKTAYGTYTGEVASIAPTATGGSQGSILDSVGSMAGISGLSSLTSSGAGVECTVTINEPDENIIIGFDADVEIQTGNYENVPVVPIESIVLEKEGAFVYKYNEKDKTVTKTKIETGATSSTSYEITSGLSVGDKIVSTPATDYEEETFKVKVVDKSKLANKTEK